MEKVRLDDVWLNPVDTRSEMTPSSFYIVEGLLGAFGYLLGYALVYWGEVSNYGEGICRYLIITLTIEAILFGILSCFASIVYACFGNNALTHALGAISLLKETFISMIHVSISLVGLYLLVTSFSKLAYGELKARLVLCYIFISWIDSILYLIRKYNSLIGIINFCVQAINKRSNFSNNETEKVQNNLEYYTRMMSVHECSRKVAAMSNPLQI